MLTLKDMNQYALELLEERLQQSTNHITAELKTMLPSIRKEYLEKFDKMFQRCYEQQEAGIKGNVAYIHIFYLLSSLCRETFELQFQVFDSNSYFDKTECMGLWTPNLFMKYFVEDMEWFDKEAYLHIVGFRYPQMLEIKRKYYTLYLGMMGQFFMNEARQIVELPSYEKMKKEEVSIIYGGYMDRGVQIWPLVEDDSKANL